ncbi:MAG TPA: hypothetical protein VFF98_12270, partial [Novosphingobium sp.]|nr:hypothetical protein [Novosphingobium sp.]
PPAPAGGRPWVIGWFGMLRCQRTLEMLGRLAAGSGGRIEVVIAGIPSAAVFPDFAAQVAAMPGLRYLGPYTKADLPRLYGQIHFVWAIDYFEEGLNSAWLLPNRLYEGLAHGAVPLALGDVATGSWLHRHGAGLLLGAPAADLPARLQALDAAGLARLRAEVDAIPDEAIWQTAAERAAIASAICGAAAAATTPARLEVAA